MSSARSAALPSFPGGSPSEPPRSTALSETSGVSCFSISTRTRAIGQGVPLVRPELHAAGRGILRERRRDQAGEHCDAGREPQASHGRASARAAGSAGAAAGAAGSSTPTVRFPIVSTVAAAARTSSAVIPS